MARIRSDTTTRVAPSQTNQVIYDGPCRVHGIILSSNGSNAASLTLIDGTTTVCVLWCLVYSPLVIFTPLPQHISFSTSLKITTNALAEGLLFVEY